MNSKLREILESVVDWAESGRTSMGRPNALEPDQAEKAIRQAVGEEMLELIGDEEDDRLSFSPEWRAGNNAKLYELRQKIKSWVGDGDE